MMNNIVTANTKGTTTSIGIFSIPITLSDGLTFEMILSRCRSLEVKRRMRQGRDPRTDLELKAIESFCDWAIKTTKEEASRAFQ